MKIQFLLILCLGLSEVHLFGHDQIVHQAITENAVESAQNHSPAFNGFINVIASDGRLFKDATNSMINGSFDEDYGPKKEASGGYRSFNHFYDPLTGLGLSETPLGRAASPIGNDSFTWGSISNCAGINFPGERFLFWNFGANQNTSNVWSWANARSYEWLGLTAANQLARQTNLDNMFRAVGQVMHLLEDTSQPQHVRNEQHLDTFWQGGPNTPWRSPIEDYGYDNVGNLNYGDSSMLDWRSAGFTKLENFWDRHLYNGNSAKLDADTDGGANTLGLAEWCNGNFLGARHTYAESFDKSDIEYYPFPSLKNTTQPHIHPHNFTGAVIDGISLPNQKFGNRVYISKTGAGVPVTHHSALSYLAAQNTPRLGGPQMHITLTIDDDNVLSNYHDIFIPKAVKYSAGLLDYYFRGTLGVSVAGDGSGNYTITVQNTSGQDFSGGSLYLFQDDESGNRTLVQQTVLSNTILPNLGTTNMTFAGPVTNIIKCILAYQGTIGVTNGTNALDPVDAGIGIAAASVSFSTNGIIYPEAPVRWFLAIVGDNDGGVPWPEALVSTSLVFNGNNGDYSALKNYFINQ